MSLKLSQSIELQWSKRRVWGVFSLDFSLKRSLAAQGASNRNRHFGGAAKMPLPL